MSMGVKSKLADSNKLTIYLWDHEYASLGEQSDAIPTIFEIEDTGKRNWTLELLDQLCFEKVGRKVSDGSVELIEIADWSKGWIQRYRVAKKAGECVGLYKVWGVEL